jgi:hypothetical protein
MMKMKNGLLFFCLAVFAMGCTTTTGITNLTASRAKRSPNNLYHVEYALNSNQQSLRMDSITPIVVVGFENYPMRKVPKMQNRWEAEIPVPADKKAVNYHYKVDYEYNAFGDRGKGSLLSPEYKLLIED